MPSYLCDDKFELRPAGSWEKLLEQVLPYADYVEVCRSFIKTPLPAVLTAAQVALPPDIQRPYCATHRFCLTPSVVDFIRSKEYQDFNSSKGEFEDPAFYQGNTLLLGTISHEDCVVMLLDDAERQHLSDQGFDFWCEWNFS